jgi:hypothetical protein
VLHYFRLKLGDALTYCDLHRNVSKAAQNNGLLGCALRKYEKNRKLRKSMIINQTFETAGRSVKFTSNIGVIVKGERYQFNV